MMTMDGRSLPHLGAEPLNDETDNETLAKIDKRKSPEHREHLKSIGRKKGDPKVPGSGRKPTPKEVKEFLASRTMEAAEFFVNLMHDDTQPIKERRMAAQWVLETQISKAATESKVEVNHTHTVTNLLADAKRQLALQDKNKTIDVTPIVIESVTDLEGNYVPLEIGEDSADA
ncbi:hypothetical protein MZK49_05615 [Ensifer sesbaniae]|uniref:hypothetical protein n=1 Tax=Ensifer sesbaniae TaxID=1214071 RepID=UPI0020011332|nr:hypothetical protein [Ensifer sesbaniae]